VTWTVHTLVVGDVRPADSTTLAAVTSAAVAAFDADISKAVEERSAAVQRAVEAVASGSQLDDDDDVDDSNGELTLGQLVDEYGPDVSTGSRGLLVGASGADKQTSEDSKRVSGESYTRDGTGSVTLTRDPTRDASDP